MKVNNSGVGPLSGNLLKIALGGAVMIQIIRDLKKSNYRVAMIGDGINRSLRPYLGAVR